MINSYAQVQISSDDNVDVEAPKELSDALSTVTTIGRNIKSKSRLGQIGFPPKGCGVDDDVSMEGCRYFHFLNVSRVLTQET